eukprot:scaffold4492_cov371-Prasinococcus_capsulatus_cf.AAC.2
MKVGMDEIINQEHLQYDVKANLRQRATKRARYFIRTRGRRDPSGGLRALQRCRRDRAGSCLFRGLKKTAFALFNVVCNAAPIHVLLHEDRLTHPRIHRTRERYVRPKSEVMTETSELPRLVQEVNLS